MAARLSGIAVRAECIPDRDAGHGGSIVGNWQGNPGEADESAKPDRAGLTVTGGGLEIARSPPDRSALVVRV